MKKKITVEITSDSAMKLKELKVELNVRSEGAVIDSLLSSYKSTNEVLDKMLYIMKEVDKNSYTVLDILNSFISNGIEAFPTDFVAYEKSPHSWVKQSRQNRSSEIFNKMKKE